MKIKLPTPLSQLLEYFIIKHSLLFDEVYYRQAYPEIGSQNPIWHFVRKGWREVKNPSPHFDTAFYLSENPDVRQAEVNPLVHFIRKGVMENRMPPPSKERLYPRYPSWVKAYDTLSKKDKRLIKGHIRGFSTHPKFTIFVIADPTEEKALTASLSSMQAQLYQHWEAFLMIKTTAEDFIEKKPLSYYLHDPRLTLITIEDEGQMNERLNQLLKEANGDFMGVLGWGASLSPHALYLLADAINKEPDAIVLYTDEDRLNANGLRIDPYFKPDWNPDLLYYQNTLNNFIVFEMDCLKEIGGFNPIKPDLLSWDLAIRITEKIKPAQIRHLPFALCHIPDNRSSESTMAFSEGTHPDAAEVLKMHFKRTGKDIQVLPTPNSGYSLKYPLPATPPLVSILIPTRNGKEILDRCLESISDHTIYENYEIIIVDNQSDETETLAYLDSLNKKELITLLSYDKPFNFSAINNFAAWTAHGEVLVFLNNDIEVITDVWLESLTRQALRPEIGAVGPMLYYPDDTIQHAGVVLGLNGAAGHIYKGQPRGYRGVRNRAALPQNLTALTAACMAIQKSKFHQLSGFDEVNLPIAFNDIDLCIRLHQAGCRNLWTPHVELYHHESASRGSDETPENIDRLIREDSYMQKTYGNFLKSDPAYNPNLSLHNDNFNLSFPPRLEKPWKNRNDHRNPTQSVPKQPQ